MKEVNTIKVKDQNGNKVEVSVLGIFKIPDLEKQYIMYGLVDDDPYNENGGVLLGEVIGEGENMQIVGILEEEKELVVAYYNEISKQIGEDENE